MTLMEKPIKEVMTRIYDIIVAIVLVLLGINAARGCEIPSSYSLPTLEKKFSYIKYPSTEKVVKSFAFIDERGTADIIIKTNDLILNTNNGYMIQLYNLDEDTQIMLVPSGDVTTMEVIYEVHP